MQKKAPPEKDYIYDCEASLVGDKMTLVGPTENVAKCLSS